MQNNKLSGTLGPDLRFPESLLRLSLQNNRLQGPLQLQLPPKLQQLQLWVLWHAACWADAGQMLCVCWQMRRQTGLGGVHA